MDFFKFYSKFDYEQASICVMSGKIQPKRGTNKNMTAIHRASVYLDVVNPLEPDLNVSANVQDYAVHVFKKKCLESLEKMEKIQSSPELSAKLKTNCNALFSYITCMEDVSGENIVRTISKKAAKLSILDKNQSENRRSQIKPRDGIPRKKIQNRANKESESQKIQLQPLSEILGNETPVNYQEDSISQKSTSALSDINSIRKKSRKHKNTNKAFGKLENFFKSNL